MATPTIRAVVGKTWADHLSGRSVTIDDAQVGDTLLVFTFCDYGDADAPSGTWTAGASAGSGSGSSADAYSVIGGVETAGEQTISLPGDNESETAIVVYLLSGVDSLDGQQAIRGNNTTQAAPSVSPAGGDDLLICVWVTGMFSGGVSYSGIPPSMTQDVSPTDGSYITALACHETLASAGDTGTRTVTSSDVDTGWAAITTAVKGSGGGPTPVDATLTAEMAEAGGSAYTATLTGAVHIDATLAGELAAGSATAHTAALTGTVHLNGTFNAETATTTPAAHAAQLAGTVHIPATFTAQTAAADAHTHPATLTGTQHVDTTLAGELATTTVTAHAATLTGTTYVAGTLNAETATATPGAYPAALTGTVHVNGALAAKTAAATAVAYAAEFDTPNAVAYPATFLATANVAMPTTAATATAHPAVMTGTTGPPVERDITILAVGSPDTHWSTTEPTRKTTLSAGEPRSHWATTPPESRWTVTEPTRRNPA